MQQLHSQFFHLLQILPEDKRAAALDCLAEDPRPSYQDDPERVYHIILKPFEISFRVQDNVAHVLKIRREPV